MRPVKNKSHSWKPVRADQYVDLQKAWLISMGGHVTGQKFRIKEKAKGDSLGWDNSWPAPMDETIGLIVEATDEPYGDHRGIPCSSGYSYPFWVLEVIE